MGSPLVASVVSVVPSVVVVVAAVVPDPSAVVVVAAPFPPQAAISNANAARIEARNLQVVLMARVDLIALLSNSAQAQPKISTRGSGIANDCKQNPGIGQTFSMVSSSLALWARLPPNTLVLAPIGPRFVTWLAWLAFRPRLPPGCCRARLTLSVKGLAAGFWRRRSNSTSHPIASPGRWSRRGP